jgi:predicted aspartyl protease
VPAFDRNYTPPAPVADVTVAHPVKESNRMRLRGKLDTGADITVIPESLIPQLALSTRSDVWTRSYDGTFTRRPVYYVGLQFEGHDLPIVRCIAASRSNVLLGRNVLNRFHITLDGRNLRFHVKAA